jgi:hypothetical protein
MSCPKRAATLSSFMALLPKFEAIVANSADVALSCASKCVADVVWNSLLNSRTHPSIDCHEY